VKSCKNPDSGFTLLEVMVSILIVSLVMTATYGVLFTTLDARDTIEKQNLEKKIGPAILDRIETDLSSAWCWNIHRNDVFFGESRIVSGERADYFHFISTQNSSHTIEQDGRPVRSDLTEVSYLLRQNPINPEKLQLWRRQDFHVDDKIAEGGLYELIYERIISFRVTYFADLHEDAERLEEWNATKRGRFPAAMEILLVMEIDPTLSGYALDEMARDRLTYQRVVFMPSGSELTMAVRPVIPTFDENAAEDDGTGSGAGDNKNEFGGGGGRPPAGGMEDGGDDTGGSGDGSGRPPPPPGFDPPDIPPDQEPPDDMDLDELLKLLSGRK